MLVVELSVTECIEIVTWKGGEDSVSDKCSFSVSYKKFYILDL